MSFDTFVICLLSISFTITGLATVVINLINNCTDPVLRWERAMNCPVLNNTFTTYDHMVLVDRAVSYIRSIDWNIAHKAFLEAQAGVTLVDGHLEASVELVENYGTIEEATSMLVDTTIFRERVEMAQEHLLFLQDMQDINGYRNVTLCAGTDLPNMACC